MSANVERHRSNVWRFYIRLSNLTPKTRQIAQRCIPPLKRLPTAASKTGPMRRRMDRNKHLVRRQSLVLQASAYEVRMTVPKARHQVWNMILLHHFITVLIG